MGTIRKNSRSALGAVCLASLAASVAATPASATALGYSDVASGVSINVGGPAGGASARQTAFLVNGLSVASEATASARDSLSTFGVVRTPEASEEDDGPRWAVVHTRSGDPLRYRTEPHTGSGSDIMGTLRDGAKLQIFCYVRGESVSGTYGRSDIWNNTRSDYWVPDSFLLTGSDDPVVPPCRSPKAPPKAPPKESKSYATPKNNPHPAVNTVAPKASPRTQFVDDEIARLTGERECWVGAYRPRQKAISNHNTGNALDCEISTVIGQYPSAAQKAQGWKLANWLRKHARLLDVRYVIWDGKIWSVERSKEGWRTYAKAADVDLTVGHYDHVHLSIQNPGNRD